MSISFSSFHGFQCVDTSPPRSEVEGVDEVSDT